MFPSFGSWISDIQSYPISGKNTYIDFVANYTTGSSNVEYAIFSSSGSTLVDYTTATNGSNSIDISSISTDYRVHYRMIGYPSYGFNPIVSSFSIREAGSGAVLQTIDLGSDIQLSTTKFTKALVNPSGSFFWLLSGSVSSDNGSTWTPITTFNQEFDITSTTGSQCVIKLSDTTGSVTLTDLRAYFHTSDVR